MTRARSDSRQKQRPAGDRFAMQVGISQTNKDVPPIVDERVEPRRQPTARQILRREAAPATLVLHLIEDAFDIPFTLPLIN